MADIDLSASQSGIIVITTSADVVITLNPGRAYDLIHLGVDSGGNDQLGARIFYNTTGAAVATTLVQAADRGILWGVLTNNASNRQAVTVGPGIRLLSVKSTVAETMMLVIARNIYS